MRILYVTPYVPSLIRTRPYNFIRALHRLGHSVTVLCATDGSESDLAALEALREHTESVSAYDVSRARSVRNCWGAVASGEPLQAAYSHHPALAYHACRLLHGVPVDVGGRTARRPFDVVHIEHLRASRILLAVATERARASGRGLAAQTPLVYDAVDSISLLFEQAARKGAELRTRAIATLELPRTRIHEARMVALADGTAVTSRQDKAALESLAARYIAAGAAPPHVSVVPNGVDLEYFTYMAGEAGLGGAVGAGWLEAGTARSGEVGAARSGEAGEAGWGEAGGARRGEAGGARWGEAGEERSREASEAGGEQAGAGTPAPDSAPEGRPAPGASDSLGGSAVESADDWSHRSAREPGLGPSGSPATDRSGWQSGSPAAQTHGGPNRSPGAETDAGQTGSPAAGLSSSADEGPRRARGSEPPLLVLSGKMSYHANIAAALYFASEVLPRIWRVEPAVRFRIVGKDPPEVIRQLAADERIEVTGEVDDMRPHIAEADVAVCPVRYAVGVQNKVLEAMAIGTPVVSAPASAAGIDARPGEELLVGEGPELFAEHVVAILRDATLAIGLSRAGRAYVERNHSWDCQTAKLVEIYERAGRTRAFD